MANQDSNWELYGAKVLMFFPLRHTNIYSGHYWNIFPHACPKSPILFFELNKTENKQQNSECHSVYENVVYLTVKFTFFFEMCVIFFHFLIPTDSVTVKFSFSISLNSLYLRILFIL